MRPFAVRNQATVLAKCVFMGAYEHVRMFVVMPLYALQIT